MNRQFVFKMQNQEAEQKRTSLPNFKLKPIEHQRFTLSNTGTMYQRPSQLQVNENESENMTSLHAKLHQEADKIRKWKVQTELEIKEKDKKLTAASTQIETMKKSLLELQLDNEKLSSRMQEEIDNREEVMQKISSTRELCNVLKLSATTLEDKMMRCEKEKEELICVEKENSHHFKELSNKFENLRLSSETNQQNLSLKFETEINEGLQREKLLTLKCAENAAMINQLEVDLKEKTKVVTELQAVLLEKNNTVDRLNQSLNQLEEKNTCLQKNLEITENDFKESALRVLTIQGEKGEVEKKLQTSETAFHSLEVVKEKMCQEMTESCTKYKNGLLSAQDNVTRLQTELDNEQTKLQNCQKELQESATSIEKLKSSRDILTLERTELELKIDLQNFEISNLRADLDEKKEDMHRLDGEISILMKRLDRENLCKMHFQEVEKDLETKICTLKLEKDEQSQTILQLEEKLENKESEVKYVLSKEREQAKSLQEDLRSKEKELEEERAQIVVLKEELDKIQEVIVRKDADLSSKTAEIDRLSQELQEQKFLTDQCQKELDQTKDHFEEFKETFEGEKRKTDELTNQLKDMNLENKEHGKSLVSQQKKFAAQAKQIKELEKEVKSLKVDLNMEKKKNMEKERKLKLMEKEIEALKQTIDDLSESKSELEKEAKTLRDECYQDKQASEQAMTKAIEMQEVAKKETENAKALTDCQLAEMMGTLDTYKQSSEKILAEKDAEVRSLKNKLEALDAKNLSQQDKLKEENNKLSSNINVLHKKTDDLHKQLMEMADENQSLKNKLQNLEKIMEDEEKLQNRNSNNKSPNFMSQPLKTQINQSIPPVAPVTPQKQIPWTPKTPKTPVQCMDNPNLLRTPQRSVLRASASVSKRRKVAFIADNQDLPSSSDDLMELEVETEQPPDKYCTPLVGNRIPKLPSGMDSTVNRMNLKQTNSAIPLSKPDLTSTPRKKVSDIPSITPLVSIAEKLRDTESKLQKPDSNPRTPNIRNVPARKTSKFFTTSPKDKAVSRTRIKNKPSKNSDGQFSWFDLDSVYGFGPED